MLVVAYRLCFVSLGVADGARTQALGVEKRVNAELLPGKGPPPGPRAPPVYPRFIPMIGLAADFLAALRDGEELAPLLLIWTPRAELIDVLLADPDELALVRGMNWDHPGARRADLVAEVDTELAHQAITGM